MHRTRIMRRSNLRERYSKSKETIAIPLATRMKSGFSAGLIGALAMDDYNRVKMAITRSSASPLPYGPQEWAATTRIANSAAACIGWKLSPKQAKRGAAIVHYTTAAAAGVVYGILRRRRKKASRWVGACFGTAIWLLGNELLLPAAGILERADFTLATRADALAEHVIFGVSVDKAYRKMTSA